MMFWPWLQAHVPLAAAVASRTIPLWGEMFGELDVVAFAGRHESGSALWRCRCQCGSEVVRSARHLFRSRRSGYLSACRSCNEEAWRGRLLAEQQDRRSGYVDYYRQVGSLYSHQSIVCELEELREHVEQELGGWAQRVTWPVLDSWHTVEVKRLPGEVPQIDEGAWKENPDGDPWCSSCRSFDLREFHAEYGFLCEACEGHTFDVWGCTGCTRVVCDECLKTRRKNAIYHDMTYEEIGKVFEVTRERVRQIEMRAMYKLRQPARVKLLQQYTVSYDPWRNVPIQEPSHPPPDSVDVEAALRRHARWLAEQSRAGEARSLVASLFSGPAPRSPDPVVSSHAPFPTIPTPEEAACLWLRVARRSRWSGGQ